MLYLIKPYFDPDIDPLFYESDEEVAQKKGQDLFNLGFVQNVVKGQIIAEIVPLDTVEEAVEYDQRFITKSIDFPAGPNTFVHPKYAQFLLSAINGIVFYYEKRITVKPLLNIRKNIGFKTGNIYFVGDMAIYGAIRSGFSVFANNIRIKGVVEGGVVKSLQNMIIDGGARGIAESVSLIEASGKLLVNFLERMTVHVSGNIVVNRNCLHSLVYGGNNILVKEQLYGGMMYAASSIFIGQQLGTSAEPRTQLFLGILPSNIETLEKMNKLLAIVNQNITFLKTTIEQMTFTSKNLILHLNVMLKRREVLQEKMAKWQPEFTDKTEELEQCRVICSGEVHPGVEITIGSTTYEVNKVYENVVFRLESKRIFVEPITSKVMPRMQ